MYGTSALTIKERERWYQYFTVKASEDMNDVALSVSVDVWDYCSKEVLVLKSARDVVVPKNEDMKSKSYILLGRMPETHHSLDNTQMQISQIF